MGKAATVKSELAINMAAVCLSSSTVPTTVIIVVEYRLVYQLIGRLQGVSVQSFGQVVIIAVLALSVGQYIVCILTQLLFV